MYDYFLPDISPEARPPEKAFNRIMKCGVCGSGITADEKFKSSRQVE
jgi:hypothetical protein